MACTAKLILVPCGFCTLFAQQPTPSTIQVTGRATVSAAPDQARMTVGVTTSAESAQEAASKNAELANALIARLRNSFGGKIEVETASYSVMQEPDQRPQQPAASAPRGFRVTNLVRVLVKDIDDLAEVIDAALSSGANRLQGLTFEVKDAEPLERKALQEAAQDARTKADALAQALGLQVVSIRTVSEGGLPPRPFERSVVAASEGFAPPIEAGTLEMTATVTLEVTVQ